MRNLVVARMNDVDLDIHLFRLLGWVRKTCTCECCHCNKEPRWYHSRIEQWIDEVPRYSQDLNLVANIERGLKTEAAKAAYECTLLSIMSYGRGPVWIWQASARQRTEALAIRLMKEQYG